ncbi:MAG: hypothetical protein KAT04_13580 [Methylococcales bacterium]|nr:hypothetical protein [Methylococcales bacterium]
MNETQKIIIIGMIIAVIAVFLFPPHAIFPKGGGVLRLGYSLITDIPEHYSIHVTLLVVEWLGVFLVGGLLYTLFKDKA